jgi:hypothetical protein
MFQMCQFYRRFWGKNDEPFAKKFAVFVNISV